MKKKKDNRGGKRKGAGRKNKAPTKTVSARVKVEKAAEVMAFLKAKIAELG